MAGLINNVDPASLSVSALKERRLYHMHSLNTTIIEHIDFQFSVAWVCTKKKKESLFNKTGSCRLDHRTPSYYFISIKYHFKQMLDYYDPKFNNQL